MTRFIGEVGHFAPLLPMLACLAYSQIRRNPSPDVWLLAAAFFVSFIADQFAAFLQHEHVTNLWLLFVYAPIQFGLMVAVLSPTLETRIACLVIVGALAFVSPLLGGFNNVEVVTQTGGGLLVSFLVLRQRALGRYAVPLLIYCIASIPPLVVMASYAPSISGPWYVGWVLYQALRVAALLSMTYAVVTQPTMRLEVRHGRGTAEGVSGSRIAFGDVGSDHSHAVATARAAGLI